eukprot:1955361-Pleurochrysis_carterae.AAC.1
MSNSAKCAVSMPPAPQNGRERASADFDAHKSRNDEPRRKIGKTCAEKDAKGRAGTRAKGLTPPREAHAAL